MKRYKYASGDTPDLSDYLHKYVKSLIPAVEQIFDQYVRENITELNEVSYEDVDEFAREVYDSMIQDIEYSGDSTVEYGVVLEIPIDVAVKAISHRIYFDKRVNDEGVNHDEDKSE